MDSGTGVENLRNTMPDITKSRWKPVGKPFGVTPLLNGVLRGNSWAGDAKILPTKIRLSLEDSAMVRTTRFCSLICLWYFFINIDRSALYSWACYCNIRDQNGSLPLGLLSFWWRTLRGKQVVVESQKGLLASTAFYNPWIPNKCSLKTWWIGLRSSLTLESTGRTLQVGLANVW